MSPRTFRSCLFVAGAVLCGAASASLAGPGKLAGQIRTAAARPHAEVILVFPFENASRSPNLDWLGEGFSELTAERLKDRQVYVLSRQDRLATLERMGLPDSARFSHATMVKIATEADADALVYGKFESDGKTMILEARLLRLNPPSLSQPLKESGSAQDMLRTHARLTWKILCALDRNECLGESANRNETTFSEPPASLRADGLENFVRGLTAPDDEARLRLLREAARLEPAWDRPAFELGQIYFGRRDWELALVWYSRVPPNHPDGPEANFAAGVCHLLRNDASRAEAAFSGLLERAHSPGSKEALPELPEFHNNLGVARLRLGKMNEAGAEFERAAALDSEEADYHFNLGIAKLAVKQPSTAAAEFERAKNIDPADKEARALLIATLQSLGRGQEAAALRSEGPESTDKTAAPKLNDAASLGRMARISKTFERSLLRPNSDAPDGSSPPGQGPRKFVGAGERP